jgi:hypothetical protein
LKGVMTVRHRFQSFDFHLIAPVVGREQTNAV